MVAIERIEEGAAFGRGACKAQGIILALSYLAEDMLAVLDGEILEVAEEGIDAGKCRVGIVVAGNAGFGGERRVTGRLDDQLGQPVAAAAIEAVCLGIFIDQQFELLLLVAETCPCEHRRQVADGDCGDASLGDRRLAGVRHDEGIDDRKRAGDALGKAILRQCHRLARQPFQRAVGADMDDGMGVEFLAHPLAEGDESVARRQVGAVVIGAAIGIAAAIRCQRHGDIAEMRGAEAEGAVFDVFARLRLAPGGGDIIRRSVAGERQGFGFMEQPVEEIAGRGRNIGNPIAGDG